MSNPPPLPVPSDASYNPTGTRTDVVNFVLAGNRFVTIPYVVSILVLSFQRTLGGVQVVRTGQWPMGKMIQAAVVTSLFGWWGFPFGIIFSILSGYYLCSGGKDATREILEKTVGREEARRILLTAPKPQPPASIWIVRAIVIVPPLLVLGLIFMILSTPMH